jgi:hypothetical protein
MCSGCPASIGIGTLRQQPVHGGDVPCAALFQARQRREDHARQRWRAKGRQGAAEIRIFQRGLHGGQIPQGQRQSQAVDPPSLRQRQRAPRLRCGPALAIGQQQHLLHKVRVRQRGGALQIHRFHQARPARKTMFAGDDELCRRQPRLWAQAIRRGTRQGSRVLQLQGAMQFARLAAQMIGVGAGRER